MTRLLVTTWGLALLAVGLGAVHHPVAAFLALWVLLSIGAVGALTVYRGSP